MFNLDTEPKMKEERLTKNSKEIELYKEGVNDTKNELTLEKARKMLNNENITDERVMNIITSLKVFSKIAYELYSEDQNQKIIKDAA